MAETIVDCTRCGEPGPALEKAPIGGPLGKAILQHSCIACWGEWRGMSVKIINEYRLCLGDPAHREQLAEQLKLFLELPEAAST